MKSLTMTVILAAGVARMATAADEPQQPPQQAQVTLQADGIVIDKKGEPQVTSENLSIRIGPDGKVEVTAVPADIKQKIERDRGAALKRPQEEAKRPEHQGDGPGIGVQGSIKIIGPDGVMHTQTFGNRGNGDPQMPDVQQLLEQAIQAAGAELPDDVREKLKQAFTQDDSRDESRSPQSKVDAAEISRKLDRTLDHLEKLEADVGELKGAKPGKN